MTASCRVVTLLHLHTCLQTDRQLNTWKSSQNHLCSSHNSRGLQKCIYACELLHIVSGSTFLLWDCANLGTLPSFWSKLVSSLYLIAMMLPCWQKCGNRQTDSWTRWKEYQLHYIWVDAVWPLSQTTSLNVCMCVIICHDDTGSHIKNLSPHIGLFLWWGLAEIPGGWGVMTLTDWWVTSHKDKILKKQPCQHQQILLRN